MAAAIPRDAGLQVSPQAQERVRKWIRAAVLRSQHKSYREIAEILGYASPQSALNAVQKGLTLLPEENTREAHRLESLRLDGIAREAMALVDDPGPLVSQGKVMYDEASGVPYPDNNVRISALQVLLKLSAEIRLFRGLNAPKRSLSVLAEVGVSDIQAHLEQLRRELGLAEDGSQDPVTGAIPGFALPPGGEPDDQPAGGDGDQDGL